jgi:hypothetical protein
MPWKPSEPGEVPTLGYYALDWIAENLATPGRDDYDRSALILSRKTFILRWYEIDPVTCRFKRHRGLFGRPRGWGKSPLAGAGRARSTRRRRA